MVQRAQVIDITKSYLPGDPNTFVQTLVNTDREDGEEKTLPVLAYEGYNFLPTAYGYKSYFGTALELDIELLDKRVQFILSYQLTNYQTRLIALCGDGIWVCNANVADSTWVHSVTLTDILDTFEEWTWCVIENILYMYRQGQANAWKTGESAGEITISTHTPTLLNMTGQMGIFKAGTRLGFWDSANSVSWSSNLDLTDFTPSLETLAGNTIFADVIGRIITIRSQGEGYIVYSSRSITGVNLDLGGNMLWDSKKIFDNVGISYSRAITYGQTDNEHFVYSTNGIYRIGKFNSLSGKHEIEPIAPEVYDFLKKSRDPIYLDTINSRYVFFHILNPDYVYGLTSFTYVSPSDLNVRFLIGGEPWDGEDLPAICIDGNAAAEALRQLVTFGFFTTYDTTALWIAVAVESQDGTIGPLSSGGGTRNADTPGFTTTDINDTYILGLTLPAELEMDPFEHVDISTKYLGNIPPGSYDMSGAAPISLLQLMYKQKVDWEMFYAHQTASMALIAAAGKVVATPGVTVEAYLNLAVQTTAELPALPATVTQDDVIGDYKVGSGNAEIQLDKPLRMLVMRKYFDEKYTVTRRKVTSYAWRQGTAGSVAGKYKNLGNLAVSGNGGGYTYVPNPIVFSQIRFSGINDAAVVAGIDALLTAQAPATTTQDGIVKNFASAYYNPASGTGYVVVAYTGGNGYIVQSLGAPVSTNLTPYYQDMTETYSYIISQPTTADMGSIDFEATQSDYGRTIISVTSDPPTIVVTSLIPIFPTGASSLTFFPPTWEGVETLKLIAASSLDPWHLIEGTFGIEAIGDPYVDAREQLESLGGCDLLGDGFIPADFGLTYSQFPYVLQVGAPFIYYPTFAGALVLDLALKKWGKQKNNYQVLIDLQPLNQFNATILENDDEGMDAALHLVDTTIKILDDMPSDSILRYGKIGSYRLGMTNILEIRIQNGKACTGTLMIDSSMDGRNIDETLRYTTTYTSARVVEAYPDISARWHVVSISGNYDLTGLETRAIISGRR